MCCGGADSGLLAGVMLKADTTALYEICGEQSDVVGHIGAHVGSFGRSRRLTDDSNYFRQ